MQDHETLTDKLYRSATYNTLSVVTMVACVWECGTQRTMCFRKNSRGDQILFRRYLSLGPNTSCELNAFTLHAVSSLHASVPSNSGHREGAVAYGMGLQMGTTVERFTTIASGSDSKNCSSCMYSQSLSREYRQTGRQIDGWTDRR